MLKTKSKGKVQLKLTTNYWSLVRELAVTDFKLKYQGSVAGYLWSLGKPLAIFGVLYLVFTVFVRVGSNIPHYPVYLLIGIVLWNYFAESTQSAMRSIVDKGDLIRKVYFPRIVLLLASSISAFITLLLNLVVVAFFLYFAHVGIQPNAPLFVLVVLELYLLSLGISFFLSGLYVRYRDFAYIWEVILQLLFYSSAIIYPLSIIPSKYLKYICLNPVTQIVQDARKLLVSSSTIAPIDVLHEPYLLFPYLVPVVLVLLGYWYFSHTAASFAEEV